MSSITPGWYPDPDPTASAGRQRWFDGAGWTQHVSAPAVARPVAPVYSGIPYAPAVDPGAPAWGTPPAYDGRIVVGSMGKDEFKALPRSLRVAKDRPDLDLARGRNSLAVNGVVAAAVSFVFSGFLVVPIVAIVWSARGLSRANAFAAQGYPPLGRSQAATGLALGIISLVLAALALVIRFGSM